MACASSMAAPKRGRPRHQLCALAFALENGERDRLDRGKLREKRVDLESACEPALHARIGLERGDVFAGQKNLARVRPQHAGEQVHERGFAGAVRPDERVAHALRQLERDVLRHGERAEGTY